MRLKRQRSGRCLRNLLQGEQLPAGLDRAGQEIRGVPGGGGIRAEAVRGRGSYPGGGYPGGGYPGGGYPGGGSPQG